MFCQFLVYSNVNQLYEYIYPLLLEPPILPFWVITERVSFLQLPVKMHIDSASWCTCEQ